MDRRGALPLELLRQRSSTKWRSYGDDVIPMFVAETDFALAPAITAALTRAVEIGDTGGGIPKELQQKIFEPFFTTKPVGEGTGLGLDISYRVVTQRHGGDLRVVSVPGDTRFQVRLPLTEPAPRG